MLLPLLLVALSGNGFCWCHGPEAGHGHGEGPEDLAASHSGHHDAEVESDHHSGASALHAPGCSEQDCECVAIEPAVAEAAKLANHRPQAAVAGFLAAERGAPSKGRSVVVPARERSGPKPSPPLFVLNCTYRC